MSLKAIVDLPDDWERGHCWNCSIGYLDDDYIHYCPYRCRGKCELKVEDSEGKNGIMKEAKLIIDGKEYAVQMKDEDIKAVTRPKTGYEFLNENGTYCSIAISGVLELPSRLDNSGIELYNEGNYYTDKKLAKDIERADRLYHKLRQWQALNDDPINWNEDIEKYHISYNYGKKEIDIYITFCRTHGVIYFSSRKTAQEAIEEFKDELTWYFTEFKQRLDERIIK